MSIIGRYIKIDGEPKRRAAARICPTLCTDEPAILTPYIEKAPKRFANVIVISERSPPAREKRSEVIPPPKKEAMTQRRKRITAQGMPPNAYSVNTVTMFESPSFTPGSGRTDGSTVLSMKERTSATARRIE